MLCTCSVVQGELQAFVCTLQMNGCACNERKIYAVALCKRLCNAYNVSDSACEAVSALQVAVRSKRSQMARQTTLDEFMKLISVLYKWISRNPVFCTARHLRHLSFHRIVTNNGRRLYPFLQFFPSSMKTCHNIR